MKKQQIIVLTLDDKIYALDVHTIERVIPAVEILILPKAPEIITGVINYQGTVIPVINMRKLFHLNEREIRFTDKIILVNALNQQIAVYADEIDGFIDFNEQDLIKPEQIAPGIEFIKGIVKRNDDMIMVYDLNSFVELDKYKELIEHNQNTNSR